jgi:hypothetical protein
VSGTSTGVINFTFSALLGPIFARILFHIGGSETLGLEAYQSTFGSLLYGVGLAILLTLLLKETGPAVRRLVPAPAGT